MPDSLEIQRAFRRVPGLPIVLKPDSALALALALASTDYLRAVYGETSAEGLGLFDAEGSSTS